MHAAAVSIEQAMAAIPDGASIGLGRPAPLPMIRELIRQGRRGLHLYGVPTGGIGIELLIAGSCVAVLEASGVDLGESGFAPAFSREVAAGALEVRDWTCPAMLMALQAGASGVDFTPVPGLLGSDLLGGGVDFRTIDNPYDPGQKVVLAPAIRPEYALVQARRIDRAGNAIISTEFDDRLLIMASRRVIVLVPGEPVDVGAPLAPREQLVPAIYFDQVVFGHTETEAEAIASYLEPAPARR